MKRTKNTAATFEQVHPLPRRFVEVDADGGGKGIFYFHRAGDYLLGYLLCRETIQTPHYPFITYKMKVLEARQDGENLIIEDDQVIEFPGNVQIRRIIDGHELIGSLVKIVFKGKSGQHKNYDVFKDTGTFYENKEPQYGKSRAKTTRRKRKPGRKSTGAGVAATA